MVSNSQIDTFCRYYQVSRETILSLNRYEEMLIKANKTLNLIGKSKIENRNRTPTISFTIEGKSSQEVSDALVSQGIALRNDNFYAWRCLKALGIDTEDGVVRSSMVHYNNIEDVDRLISAFTKTNILSD